MYREKLQNFSICASSRAALTCSKVLILLCMSFAPGAIAVTATATKPQPRKYVAQMHPWSQSMSYYYK